MNTDALLHPNTSTKSAKKVRQTKASTWDGTGTLPIAQMSEEQLTHALESMPELPKGSSKEEKKHRRLIRNRMAAQLSRERKKMAMENLQSQLDAKTQECQALRDALKSLQPLVPAESFEGISLKFGLGVDGGSWNVGLGVPSAESLSENSGSDDDSMEGEGGGKRGRIVSVAGNSDSSSSNSVSTASPSLSPTPQAPSSPKGNKGRRKRGRGGKIGANKVAKVAMMAGLGLCAMVGVGIIGGQQQREVGFVGTQGMQHRKLIALEQPAGDAALDKALETVETSLDKTLEGAFDNLEGDVQHHPWVIDPVENFPGRWLFGGRNTPYTYGDVRQLYPPPTLAVEEKGLRGGSKALVAKVQDLEEGRGGTEGSKNFIFAPNARAVLGKGLLGGAGGGEDSKALVVKNTGWGWGGRENKAVIGDQKLTILMPTKGIVGMEGEGFFNPHRWWRGGEEWEEEDGEEVGGWTELTCKVTGVKVIDDVGFRT